VRSLLRTSALRSDSPGEVLEQVNDLLVADIPANMFVTCLYAILDPAAGLLRFANAGHDLPYRRRGGEVTELRATGMPLGLLPGRRYEENETLLEPGDRVLFYSDGLVEAHDPARQLFGFPRLRALLADDRAGGDRPLVEALLTELIRFAGPDWEQEDDIMLVTLDRVEPEASMGDAGAAIPARRRLAAFELPSRPGVERLAMQQVAAAVEALALPPGRLERLKTAVAEATMNAAEHGNRLQPEAPVAIEVLASEDDLAVRITDRGAGPDDSAEETPDLEAKLEGRQRPRGWGLFLIRRMVDAVHESSDGAGHTVELVLRREGDQHGGTAL
jgi:anti-sigma regulatory factor (Ser/Thr protein kinase)